MKIHALLLTVLAAIASPAGLGAQNDKQGGVSAQFQLYPGRAKSKPANTDPVGGQRSNGGGGTGLTLYSSLTGVTAIRTEASVGSSEGGKYVFANLRIASNQTTLDDYIVGTYTPDLISQRLQPNSFRKYAGVGLFGEAETLLLKDNVAPINFYTNPATPAEYPSGVLHNFQSGTAYKTNLSTAQSLGFSIQNISVGRVYRVTLTDACNEVLLDERIDSPGTSSVLVFSGIPAFLTGTYQLTVEPVTPATAFTYQVLFSNQNSSTVTTVTTGATLSASFPGRGRPYKKYKVRLTSGQTITCPVDADTEITFMNSANEIIRGASNAGLIQTVTRTDDYYIILTPISTINNSTETYSGVMTITNSISYLDWSWLYRLRNDRDAAGEDADGDGMTNLMEYALDSDPDDASDRGAVTASVTGSDLSLSFIAPNYVQGVTYAAEFSANGTAWPTSTIATTGTVDGGSVRQASVARSTGRRMGRLRVTATP